MENKAFDHIRTVNYYETDKMGITHHSNYIRWMEEARTAFLNRHGCGYAWFDSEGVVSPVLSVSCQYKHSSTFEDRININVSISEYTGIKIKFRYVMTNADTGALIFTGESEHCFLDRNGMPVIIRKRFHELDETLKGLVEPPKNA